MTQCLSKGRKKPLLSEHEMAFVRDHYLDMSYKEIAARLGYTERQIRGWINNHCPKKNRTRNSDYFSKINTPEKAYWLGFIYADGWISRHKRSSSDGCGSYTYEFGMQLQTSDKYMLDRLNIALGGQDTVYFIKKDLVIANNPHKTHTESYALRVYSKQIVNDLYSHGIDFNKSYSSTFPIVASELFPHFLRGYIDGDGCICRQNNGRSLYVHITAYGAMCLRYIQEFIHENYQITSAIYAENDHKHRLVVFNQENVRRLLDIIYSEDGDLYLTRKKDVYHSFYGLAA